MIQTLRTGLPRRPTKTERRSWPERGSRQVVPGVESQLCKLAVHRADLLDCLAVSDCLHGDPGLELVTVGAALTQLHLRRLRLRRESRIRAGTPAQRLTIRAVQKKPDHLSSLTE